MEASFELDGYLVSEDTPIRLTDFVPPAISWFPQDVDNPVEGTRLFGEDGTTAGELTLSMVALHAGCEQAVAELQAIWFKDRGLGAVVGLKYTLYGRDRWFFGRPRSFNAVPRRGMPGRLIDITATFALKDGYSYGAEETALIDMVPASFGGLVSPVISPVTTIAEGTRQGQVFNSGQVPTPIRAKFNGPIANPSLSSAGWNITLDTTIADDVSVTADARALTVKASNGGSRNLKLFSYLSDARLRTGWQDLTFTGSDGTGSSSVNVYWRPAYYGF